MKKLILVYQLAVFVIQVFPQPKTNLQIIETLIEKSITSIDSLFSKNTQRLYLEYISPPSYLILKSNVLTSLVNNGYELKSESQEGISNVLYSISNVIVKYSESFKTGFFGSLITERTISLEGTVAVEKSNNLLPSKFTYSYRDTINVDEISNVENDGIEFTKAPVPLPNIFSNLLEPIIVVGTLIVTIFLLFVVRSK
ncbi:MAG: hypothetical protein FJ214_08790 [Ignavibacteria bacterium]|nr:hypothetical protein [Ignavibacteria bacterium]